MNHSRFNPPAFNPEKFLAKESKKAKSPLWRSMGVLLPITFSNERRKALIARLAVESPTSFYRGSDLEAKRTALATLTSEIGKEVESIGVAADAKLVHLLLIDVVRDSAWRRVARAKKNS